MLRNFSNWLLATYVNKREDARQTIEQIIKNERGAGAVEYGLLIAVIVTLVIIAATVMKDPLEAFFQKVVQTVTDMF